MVGIENIDCEIFFKSNFTVYLTDKNVLNLNRIKQISSESENENNSITLSCANHLTMQFKS